MKAYIALLRTKQWIKNLLLFFPPFFGGTIFLQDFLEKAIPAFISFSVIASSHYIINDIHDLEADKCHSTKKHRPLASGTIKIKAASLFSVSLLAVGIFLSFHVSPYFWGYLLAYLLIALSYTFYFKAVVIMDIFMISSGFLVRVLAGGEAFGIQVSNWLFMTVFLVSLFLATGKRMGERVLMGEEAFNHRKNLAVYSDSFLNGALWFSGAAALVTYALYTVERETDLFYTVPIAAYGLLRYIYLASLGKGEPTDALLRDRQTMVVGIIWATSIAFFVYRGRHFPVFF